MLLIIWFIGITYNWTNLQIIQKSVQKIYNHNPNIVEKLVSLFPLLWCVKGGQVN
jgi:hypothetical protein